MAEKFSADECRQLVDTTTVIIMHKLEYSNGDYAGRSCIQEWPSVKNISSKCSDLDPT